MRKYGYISACFFAVLFLVSCGTKRYQEPERCEDLSTVYFNDVDPSTWTIAQRNAVARFAALEGDWLITVDCGGEQKGQAMLTISEALSSNVEMYQDVEDADCDLFGKAAFEARISNSGDIDLDDITYMLTANLLLQTERGGNLMEAETADMQSQYDGIAGFSLSIVIDEDGVPGAIKEVTMVPEISDENNNISVTRKSYCYFTDWVKN